MPVISCVGKMPCDVIHYVMDSRFSVVNWLMNSFFFFCSYCCWYEVKEQTSKQTKVTIKQLCVIIISCLFDLFIFIWNSKNR